MDFFETHLYTETDEYAIIETTSQPESEEQNEQN